MSFLDKISLKKDKHVPVLLNEQQVRLALSVVMDPDLNKDIVSLGFVQEIKISGGKVSFKIVLTTPACPVKDKIKQEAEDAVKNLPNVSEVAIEMTAITRAAANP